MTPKLVSIIIPTFNRASLVGEAIRSAQEQSYSAKQIIVIDDGSYDNTTEVIKQFQGIEYYRQENKGQASARNLGLHYAKGEYITTLDSDDIWHSNFLSDSINWIEKNNLDFVFLNWVSNNGKESFIDSWEKEEKWRKYTKAKTDNWFLLDPKYIRRLFLEACPAPSSSLVIRRSSFVSQWNEDMIAADDWFLLLEMVLSKPCQVAFTTSPHWFKRVHGDNVYDGRNKSEVITNALHDEEIFKSCFSSRLTSTEKKILNKRLAFYHVDLGRIAWKHHGISKNMLTSVVTGVGLAPLGVCFQIMKIFKDHVKHRTKKLLSNF